MSEPKDVTAVLPPKKSVWFSIGVFLLLVNIPVGWLGMVLGPFVLAKTGDKKLASMVGFGIYGLSWVMIGAGFVLAGKDGMAYSKQLWARFRKKT